MAAFSCFLSVDEVDHHFDFFFFHSEADFDPRFYLGKIVRAGVAHPDLVADEFVPEFHPVPVDFHNIITLQILQFE